MISPKQTNLFNRDLLPKVDWLSTPRMSLLLMIIIFVMSALSIFSIVRANIAMDELASVEKRVEHLRKKKLQELPASTISKEKLLEEIQYIDEKIKASRDFLAAMDQTLTEKKSGSIAQVMTAISKVNSKSLWLDSIKYSVETRSLALQGHASDPKAVAPYIESIRYQPGLDGVNIGQLEVISDSSNEKLWSFSIVPLKSEAQVNQVNQIIQASGASSPTKAASK